MTQNSSWLLKFRHEHPVRVDDMQNHFCPQEFEILVGLPRILRWKFLIKNSCRVLLLEVKITEGITSTINTCHLLFFFFSLSYHLSAFIPVFLYCMIIDQHPYTTGFPLNELLPFSRITFLKQSELLPGSTTCWLPSTPFPYESVSNFFSFLECSPRFYLRSDSNLSFSGKFPSYPNPHQLYPLCNAIAFSVIWIWFLVYNTDHVAVLSQSQSTLFDTILFA